MIVLTDEIFSHMVYAGAEHKTIAAVEGMADRSILVNTFSKTYIMTGFRIGWCVANKDLITAMDIFQQNSVTNVPAFVQLAALAAITGPQDHVEVITAQACRPSATRPWPPSTRSTASSARPRTARSTSSPTSAAPA